MTTKYIARKLLKASDLHRFDYVDGHDSKVWWIADIHITRKGEYFFGCVEAGEGYEISKILRITDIKDHNDYWRLRDDFAEDTEEFREALISRVDEENRGWYHFFTTKARH